MLKTHCTDAISMMRTKTLRILPVCILLTALAACCALLLAMPHNSAAQEKSSPAKNSQANPQTAASGKQTFETICAGCHGLDGQGGERGANIVSRPEVRKLSDRELLQVVRDGRPAKGMPPFSALGDTQLASVVSHLRGLQGKGTVEALPGDPVAGKELFFGSAGCSSCHMIRGAGGFLGADLSSYGANVSPKDMREAILSPNKENDPRRRTITVTTEDGKAFTGIVRNEDNFSLQLQATDGTFHLFSKSGVKSVEVQSQSLMPAEYGSKLSSKQLDDLINYLVSVGKAAKHSHGKNDHDDEDDDGE
jgi:putative heme-binding domain-containing protein